jgi:hypothetical protein
MDLQKQFATNKDKETNGVWTPIGDEGGELLIARITNHKYKQMVAKLMRPHARKARRGVINIAIVEDITKQAMAKHILLGWKKITINGKLTEYSKANALSALRDYNDFYELVSSLSEDVELFRDEAEEDEAKNSEAPSDGSSSTESS